MDRGKDSSGYFRWNGEMEFGYESGKVYDLFKDRLSIVFFFFCLV